MAHHHRELHYRLYNVEKLRLYAQSATIEHRALQESLDKAKSLSKHWDQEAKEGKEKMKGAKEERDKAKEKTSVARLATVAIGDTKA